MLDIKVSVYYEFIKHFIALKLILEYSHNAWRITVRLNFEGNVNLRNHYFLICALKVLRDP